MYKKFYPFRVTFFCFAFIIFSFIILFVTNFFNISNIHTSAISVENSSKKEVNFGKLAIIIDDFGQNRNGVREMMALDRPLTFAVMPYLKFTEQDAQSAKNNGFEVIAHIPMESLGKKISWLGPKPILNAMTDDEIYEITKDTIKNVPHAVGANIHMGSRAGDSERIICDVLTIIKDENLYFVDSRASKKPVAKKIGDSIDATCYDRDVFLDGTKNISSIKKNLRKAGEVALKNGFAIAIGHVGTEGGKVTAQAIKDLIPELESKNIKFIFVSDLYE